MSKRLDILGARIFGASVCHAPKYLQLFRKCPNVWTKSPDLAIMHKHKPYTSSTYTCICAFCYFINFLHTFLDIFIGTGETTFLFPFALFSSILINMHLKSLEIVRLRKIVHYRISISFGGF